MPWVCNVCEEQGQTVTRAASVAVQYDSRRVQYDIACCLQLPQFLSSVCALRQTERAARASFAAELGGRRAAPAVARVLQ